MAVGVEVAVAVAVLVLVIVGVVDSVNVAVGGWALSLVIWGDTHMA